MISTPLAVPFEPFYERPPKLRQLAR